MIVFLAGGCNFILQSRYVRSHPRLPPCVFPRMCLIFFPSAFRRLPEGQIESMWSVFATRLREGWSSPTDVDDEGDRSGSGGGGVERYLLAREVDAELFVLFLRNLHVTSSVASAVGRLCTSLAKEVIVCFHFASRPPGMRMSDVGVSDSTRAACARCGKTRSERQNTRKCCKRT